MDNQNLKNEKANENVIDKNEMTKWQKFLRYLKICFKRLTESKVAWMALPASALPFIYILTGSNSLPDWFEAFWGAIWVLLMTFIGANNPDNKDDI